MSKYTTAGGSIKPQGTFFDLYGDHVQRYVWASQFLKNAKVLDAGCGHGYGSYYLAQDIASYVLGIDTDSKAIHYAWRHYRASNLDFKLMDVTKITVESEPFDAVVSFEVIEHLINAEHYLKEICRVLKPYGLFFLSTPNRKHKELLNKHGVSTNPLHIKEYYPDEIQKLLNKYFIIKGAFCEFHINDVKLPIDLYINRMRYASRCMIPTKLRRIFPSFVKTIWLKLNGLPSIPEYKGRWKDFQITQVNGADAIDWRFPTQLWYCTKKSN